MLIRRNPNVPYCWIPDTDTAIDRANWSEDAQRRYFAPAGAVDYTLPPILPGETPVRVYLKPLSHAGFLRVQALEAQKGVPLWEDAEIRDLILSECITDVRGVGEEVVADDGTVQVVELPHARLFDASGKINGEGLSFFHNALLAGPATAVAWTISHSRYSARPASPEKNAT